MVPCVETASQNTRFLLCFQSTMRRNSFANTVFLLCFQSTMRRNSVANTHFLLCFQSTMRQNGFANTRFLLCFQSTMRRNSFANTRFLLCFQSTMRRISVTNTRFWCVFSIRRSPPEVVLIGRNLLVEGGAHCVLGYVSECNGVRTKGAIVFRPLSRSPKHHGRLRMRYCLLANNLVALCPNSLANVLAVYRSFL